MKTKLVIPALLICLPTFGCEDASPPAWPEGAELTLSLDEDAIVAEWPEAKDDKGIVTYTVSVDGTPAVEAGADARNWKAMDVSVGNPHEISVVAIDAKGNETAPLSAKWEAKDLEGPTWPVGSLLQVHKVDPTAEPSENGEFEVTLKWPEPEDPSGVATYRVVKIPTTLDTEVMRPKLIGLIPAGINEKVATGLPSTKFQVYAVDKAENSSVPLSGALDNPTKLNPTKSFKQLAPPSLGDTKIDKAELNTDSE